MSLSSIGSILSTARENLAQPRRPPKTKNKIPAATRTAKIFQGMAFKISSQDIDVPPCLRLVSARDQVEPQAWPGFAGDHRPKPI